MRRPQLRSPNTGRVLGVALAVCLTSACAARTQPDRRPAADTPAAQGALAAFYRQQPDWQPCPDDDIPELPESPSGEPPARFECTTVTVPLDYQDPDGDTIEVALNRLPAADPDKRIGSLLTNPGGPGGSGVGFVYIAPVVFTPTLRAHYDIIGMDPRGIGQSSPVDCQSPEEAARTAEQHSDDEAAQAKAFVAACEDRSGEMLPHVGTDNVARDLDVVRAVLGDDKLHYLGISYGTVLGQFYARQFPDKVGRMVLDSVADLTVWPADPSGQVRAMESTLNVFVESCVATPDCPLGADRASVMRQLDELVTQLETDPLPTGPDTPPITQAQLRKALAEAMYDESGWPQLADALAAASDGDGAALADYVQPDSASGGFEAVMCPHMLSEDRTEATAREGILEATSTAPVVGEVAAAPLLRCAYWPVPSMQQAGRAVTGDGIPPILLVNNRYDPATPVAWARGVHGQLPDSTLVINDAAGHGFYNSGPCTARVVDDYLTAGKMPASGTTCNDRAPNVTAPQATPTPNAP